MESCLIDTLDELINHGDLKIARRVLEYVSWTFSRYNEYVKRIHDLENSKVDERNSWVPDSTA